MTISQDGFLKVFDLFDKVCQKSFKICEVCLSAITPVKPDELYALGSWDNNIYLFNIVSGNKSKAVVAHDNSISDLLYLPRRKRLVSSSWDCSVKFWRVVGSNLDNEEIFHDHANQVTTIAKDEEENWLAIGDIEGNIVCVSIEEKEKVWSASINSQKIARLYFLHSNLVVAGETDIRHLDNKGMLVKLCRLNGLGIRCGEEQRHHNRHGYGWGVLLYHHDEKALGIVRCRPRQKTRQLFQ